MPTLHWLTREQDIKAAQQVPYRLLEEVPDLGYGDKDTGNMLIYHPWLDTMLETSTHLIGIESKRYEPFRHKNPGEFSKAYWRPRWGNNMAPFEGMRDRLAANSMSFERLDAAQLVKHAFGLRTEGQRRRKRPILLYLFVEPSEWPDGRPIDPRQVAKHRSEAMTFAEEVKGAEVAFALCSYNQLLAAFAASPVPGVCEHASSVMDLLGPLLDNDGAPTQ